MCAMAEYEKNILHIKKNTHHTVTTVDKNNVHHKKTHLGLQVT